MKRNPPAAQPHPRLGRRVTRALGTLPYGKVAVLAHRLGLSKGRTSTGRGSRAQRPRRPGAQPQGRRRLTRGVRKRRRGEQKRAPGARPHGAGPAAPPRGVAGGRPGRAARRGQRRSLRRRARRRLQPEPWGGRREPAPRTPGPHVGARRTRGRGRGGRQGRRVGGATDLSIRSLWSPIQGMRCCPCSWARARSSSRNSLQA